MEILQQFGFKPELFIAQVVNFLILAYIFKRFLYKPLLSVIKKREKTIAQGLKDAEAATVLKEETEKQRNEILKKTRKEAEGIVDEAKKTSEELRLQMREETKKEAERLMKEAKEQAEQQMQKMEKKLTDMSLTLSQDLLNNVTKNLFTEEERKQIIKRSVSELKKN